MDFKKLKLKNFMSVGKDAIEVDFQQLSGVYLIKGENRDIAPEASNGAGKSLLIEGILWVLYGKTLRGLTTNEVINNVSGKKCVGILDVGDLRIQRSRKPNKLKIFEDPSGEFGEDTEISQAKMTDTQKLLIEKIGVDFTTFCNIFCFGQHNLFSFVSTDEKTRREIVEDLLSLSDYNHCLEIARSSVREAKGNLKSIKTQVETIRDDLSSAHRTKKNQAEQRKKWKEKIDSEISDLKSTIDDLGEIDCERILKEWALYERAQSEVPKVRAEISRISDEIRSRKRRATDCAAKVKEIDRDVKRVSSLQPGVVCKHCFGEVDPKNAEPYLEQRQTERAALIEQAEDEMIRAKPLKGAEKKARQYLQDLMDLAIPKQRKEMVLEVKEKISKAQVILEEKKKQSKEDPYTEMLRELEEQIVKIDEKRRKMEGELTKTEELLPYLEFWVEAFGPEGIRSFILENVIDFLNGQINYWLQFLIDNKIKVHFDKFLEVSIERENGEPFDYKQGSGGETKRVDLSISLAFADLMRISNNTHNNIIFLDEVVDSLDLVGVNGVFSLVSELCKDKIVFVITHNPILLNRLEESGVLKMVKENGFTTLEDS